jgi:hypothetical protein
MIIRKTILNMIEIRIKNLIKHYNFDTKNDWSQVNGKSEEIIRMYGQFEQLLNLYFEITGNLYKNY